MLNGFNEAPADQPGKGGTFETRMGFLMASMRPRLISRGNKFAQNPCNFYDWASMRPRLISRGNGALREGPADRKVLQ